MYKVIIFGVGSGFDRVKNYIDYNKVEIVAYADNDRQKQGNLINNIKIINPFNIKEYKFDYIFITSMFDYEIREQLREYGIDDEKIISFFIDGSFRETDNIIKENMKKHEKMFEFIQGKFKSKLMKEMGLCGLKNLGRARKIDILNYIDYISRANDYIRISSLELVANEIKRKNLGGNVAELGVYRGDFAKEINKLFPDRKMYLFDTFEGFYNEDIFIDKNSTYSISNPGHLADTSIEIVLSKMEYSENCVVKKGYFPDTALNLDEKFVFVSIDADLYKPIYEGLVYFYPRLVKGGYIFVHDYNNDKYKGAKYAVRDFCQELKINFFPLSDFYGSAIIMK